MSENIGKRIKEKRTNKLRITQGEFANLLNVDKTCLSKVEFGKQNLTLNTLFNIWSKLDVSLCVFLNIFNRKECEAYK